MSPAIPRICITPGEPAGIGPDLVVELSRQAWPFELVVIGDAAVLTQRAAQLGQNLTLKDYDADAPPSASAAGELTVLPISCSAPVTTGSLDTANAGYVLTTLKRAAAGCSSGEFAALVTGPVHKGIINDAGISFSGHTEFLAEETGAPRPVMMLVAEDLRVALVTTHLALADVPAAITKTAVEETLRIVNSELRDRFGISSPHTLALGLNPHAGESGHMGREEIDVIEPVLEALRTDGINVSGPLPADTAFTPRHLADADAVVAMFHDQGLPVLKYAGFGSAVNVTLGLPIIRTSVDHGTALDLAGTGQAESGSFVAALELAATLASHDPAP